MSLVCRPHISLAGPALALAAALAGSSCGDSPTRPPVAVTLSPATVTIVLGDSRQLSATVANASDPSVVWRSSTPSVASVDASGLVTAVGAGAATITAVARADTARRASAQVTVPSLVLTLSAGPGTLLVGQTHRLSATLENALDATVTWRSSAPGAVDVDATGLLRARGGGSATITALARADSSTRASLDVTVPAVSVSVTPAGALSLLVGARQALVATVSNAVDSAVTWRSSAPAIAGVDAAGMVSALATGTATVSAVSAADTTARAAIVVTVLAVVVTASPGAATLLIGEARRLTASVTGAVDTTVTWRSGAPSVATVDAGTGVVTGVAPGQATITAIARADTARRAASAITVPAPSISLTQATITVLPGQSYQLRASVTNALDTAVVWRSSAPGVATVNETGLVTAVAAGTATISAQAVADPNAVATAVVTVLAPAQLAVTITGLPAGTLAGIRVTGPGSYSATANATATLTGLIAGSYTLTAGDVVSGAATYTPTPASQTVQLAAGAAGTAAVAFSIKEAFNVAVENVYITQATQTYDRAVPLVAGRDGWLRVFVTANKANTATPPVRVRLYSGATLVSTFMLAAPGGGVPQAVAEGSLAASWNLPLAGSLIQPGLGVLADVDPDWTLQEDRSDDVYPRSAAPLAMDVRSVPTFSARLVPIYHSSSGLTGNATSANKDSYLTDVVRMFPVRDYDVDVRGTFTTSAGSLTLSASWLQVLQEIDALRITDGNSRYYYGVLPATSGAAWCGYGYVPGKSAIGTYECGAITSAHEWGHNFDRSHAPCGGVADADPSYPYSGATLGVWGMDVAAGTLVPPSSGYDIMGYCWPKWISDYTYTGILAYRAAVGDGPAAASAGEGAMGPALLVWGRVEPDGRVVLEPALELDAPARLPSAPGPDALDGLDAAGNVVFSLSFAARPVADAPGDARHFAFAVPVTWAPGRLAALRLRAAGHAPVTRASAGPPTPAMLARLDASLTGRAVASNAVRLAWDAADFTIAMVRDRSTGALLAFARAGDVVLRARPGDLDITFSDGVRSVHRTITAR